MTEAPPSFSPPLHLVLLLMRLFPIVAAGLL